jgi:hypothetical protein
MKFSIMTKSKTLRLRLRSQEVLKFESWICLEGTDAYDFYTLISLHQ